MSLSNFTEGLKFCNSCTIIDCIFLPPKLNKVSMALLMDAVGMKVLRNPTQSPPNSAALKVAHKSNAKHKITCTAHVPRTNSSPKLKSIPHADSCWW